MSYKDNRFYVYVHRRASDGRIFYVGKGRYGRYKDIRARNQHWNNVVNKHGFTAHIVMRFDREDCAFSIERALIAYYGIDTLCNLSSGGEGCSGVVRSDEYRRNVIKRRSGIELSERHRESIRMSTRSATHRKLLSEILKTPEINSKLVASAKRQFMTDEAKERHSRMCGGSRVIRSDGVVFGSVSEAARKMSEYMGKKCAGQNIDRACRNEGYSAFGFGWSFHKDD